MTIIQQEVTQQIYFLKQINNPLLFFKELGLNLVRYLSLLREGKDQDILNEINQLPKCEKWINPHAKINYVNAPESSSDSEGESMDVEMCPSTSGSTTAVKEEDIGEPGWTVVKTRKKK